MATVKLKKESWWTRRMRKAGAYGPLDRALRQWRSLGSVRTNTGVPPNGDRMVYRMNNTTLEIGQGTNTFKGMVGLAGLCGLILMATASTLLPEIFSSGMWHTSYLAVVIAALACPLLIFLSLLFLSIFLTDFFGYTDALLRFDRTRRKVWMFVGTRTPIELDWDRLTPVSQGVTPANTNVNTFRAVLLVDLDEQGEVRFDGHFPRIASLGQTSLNEQYALGQYEYVRQFMETGPASLPRCETYLEHRTGLRDLLSFFDLLDIPRRFDWHDPQMKGFGLLLLVTLACTAMAPMIMLFSIASWIAYRCNRVPTWPAQIEACAAEGGVMRPPADAHSQRQPIVWKEVPFILLWTGSALAFYTWVASWFLK
ncbi:DUF6708 domain-containing protein [Paraburkholderia caribensis]|uniref:DUF6708 domain-containing protein n=5 Tax=Paraburkholderia caribensis TaxID=75105 RepID=UPI00078D48FB|nr:DUF6708 domain-containing protein [Paraburkholderia caribensis]AMV46775.1 hypothetical protein ATN79_33035 [Paraburkholderia caribensis]